MAEIVVETPPVSNSGRRRPKPKRKSQYWMLVINPENFRRTLEQGFTVQGIRSRHRRRAEAMREGDKVLYYITGRMAFAAICTLTSSLFEDHSLIWRAPRRDEDYPWRFKVRPDEVLDENEWLPARELAYRMEYVRKWPPEYWALAFVGHVHQLAQKDYKLVETELRRAHAVRAQ
jgi:hypothetical protein